MSGKNYFVRKKPKYLKLLVQIFIFIAFFGVLGMAFDSVSEGNQEQEIESLKTAIDRASVHCYATEGAYPDSLEYLEENYALQVNHDKYIIHYDVFATNIKPDVTVLRR